MKFITSLLLSLLFIYSPALAEKEDEKLVSKRLWDLAALPAWHILWVNIHEGSHALTAISYDYEMVSYKPYPHIVQGRFVFGSFLAKCPGMFNDDFHFIPKDANQRCLNGGGRALIAIAPSIADIGIFALSDILLSTKVVGSDNLSGRLLYVGGMVAPWIDLAYGTNTYWSKATDHAQFSEETGFPRWSIFLAGNAFVAVGAWRLYAQGKEVFYDTPRKTKKRSVMFLPFTSPNSTGMALSLAW